MFSIIEDYSTRLRLRKSSFDGNFLDNGNRTANQRLLKNNLCINKNIGGETHLFLIQSVALGCMLFWPPISWETKCAAGVLISRFWAINMFNAESCERKKE